MRSSLLLLFLTISVMVSAETYFVAPNGRDTYKGTKEQPWATWGKAFASVNAGDSVYFRGGVYYSTAGKNGYSLTKSGTINDTIFFLNYPNEVPILDCNDQPIIASDYSLGITISYSSYIKLRGLTIRNVWQYDGNDEVTGWAIENSRNIVIENCKVYNTHGHGFGSINNNNLRYRHCDTYNNCDSLTTVPISNPLPGNDGTGFFEHNNVSMSYSVYYYNCRAWNCGDQGFSSGSIGYSEYDVCWAFMNGQLEGAGFGFKMGWVNPSGAPKNRLYKNCIAAFNRVHGWTTNDQDYGVGVLKVYNCTSYHNGYQGWHNPEYGFYIENTKDDNQTTETANRIYKNNIAYANEGAAAYAMSGAGWTHDHNSWDIPLKVTDADFLSLDSTGISGPRKADGSLPDLAFLKLAPGSALIDAGIDLGLNNNGTLPDLGAYESVVPSPNLISVTSITVTGAGGATSIITNNGSLQLTAVILPSNATNKAITWSIANGTGQASISSSGLVTAASNGTVTAKATANDGSGVYGTLLITVLNQVTAVNQPPLVVLSSPTKSTSYVSPASITIEAAASDPDGTITKVEFYNGTIKLGERTVSPYSYTWKEVTDGTYSITAIATDNGNSKTTSAPVTVIVEKSAIDVNQTPIVSIISPENNKKYKKNDKVVIKAVASDPDGTISKVEFKSGTITLAEMTSAPYLLTWEAADTGKYIITAVATDNMGATSTSEKIELTVDSFYDAKSEVINLYPNPNNGHFTINLLSALPQQDYSVSIVNLTGKMVYKGVLRQKEYIKEFDISGFPSGTYILMVSTSKNVITASKFIKN